MAEISNCTSTSPSPSSPSSPEGSSSPAAIAAFMLLSLSLRPAFGSTVLPPAIFLATSIL